METWDDAEHDRWGDSSRRRPREEYALTGIDELKRALRERAESVMAREHELLELRTQLARRLAELDKKKGSRRDDAKLAAREKQLAEREQKLAERERELRGAIAAAEEREREAAAEHALATAERERLDEREQAVRDVERELAGLRRRLEEERAAFSVPAPPPPPAETDPAGEPEPPEEPPGPTPLPTPPEEPELDPAAAVPAKTGARRRRGEAQGRRR
jgi:hypothetical protein